MFGEKVEDDRVVKVVEKKVVSESETASSLSGDVRVFREINRGLAKASASNKLLTFICPLD